MSTSRSQGKGGLTGWERLDAPVDIASLVVFRAMFGAILLGAVMRFGQHGWIDAVYVQPELRFPYAGLEFVRPWPQPWMDLHFMLMGTAALGIAIGAWYRLASALYLVSFLWVALIDKTTYLNHYPLVAALAALCCVLPLHGALSVDAWVNPEVRRTTVPLWMLRLVQAQVTLAYLHQGIARLGSEWLATAQPIRIWLATRADAVGGWLAEPAVAWGFAVCGVLLDLTAPWLLTHAALRPWVFVILVLFHLTTGALFPAGILPWLLLVGALVFLPPSWPRAVLSDEAFLPDKVPEGTVVGPTGPRLRAGWWGPAVGAWLAVMVIWPLRGHAMTADALWTDHGTRWSWRAMMAEKVGVLEYRVVDRSTGVAQQHDPSERLTAWQLKAVATQPDLILQYAHRLRDEEREMGRDVAVYADAWIALNGRESQRYVRPDVDLTEVVDGWGERWWLEPLDP